MGKVKFLMMAVLVLGIVGLELAHGEKDKAKYTIKEVMKEVHAGKDSLRGKIISGKGDKADKEKLLEYYEALPKCKPPMGDEAAWKERTAALIKAAKDVLADKAGAIKELDKVTNCMSCHKSFKGK